MFGPVLRGPRVMMRPPTEDDVPHFLRWLADTEVTKYLGFWNTVPSLEQEKDWIKKAAEDRNSVVWTIELEGAPIGNSSIRNIDWKNQNGETGTLIGELSRWGKGLGTESMRLRTAYAFNELNLVKLHSGAFMENEASKRAQLAAGYRQAGILRKHVFTLGRWHDLWMSELLREDWERTH
jgi:RimJ/RimL family protein N-acetyltransferase